MSINISASLLQDFLTCPQKVFYRLTNPDAEIKNVDMAVGTLVHTTIEKFWNDRTEALNYVKEMSETLNLDSDKEAKAINSIYTFFNNFSSLLNNEDLVEYKFKLPLEKGVFLVGKIDRISDGKIFDWKTSTITPKSIDNDIQFLIYSEAYRRIFKKEPDAVFYASLSSGELVRLRENKILNKYIFDELVPVVIKAVRYKNYYRKGIFTHNCFRCTYKNICYSDLNYGIFNREFD